MKSEDRRGNPDSLCLPVEYLNGWLFGINANRVKPGLREKVLRYQRDCYHVLWEAFNAQAPIAAHTSSPLEQIRATTLAVAHAFPERAS